jgi:hypothetical protein
MLSLLAPGTLASIFKQARLRRPSIMRDTAVIERAGGGDSACHGKA